MKNDIDFDELDKAVGAVLNTGGQSAITNQSTEAAPPKDDQPTPNQLSTPEPTATVKSESAEAKPAPKASQAKSKPTSTSPALKRSGGRFMDMVHPSADMKKAAAASAPIKHSANKLQPLSADIKKDSDQPSAATTAAAPAAQSDYEPAPPAADLAASGFVSMPDDDKAANAASTGTEWPDPLDVDKPEATDAKTDDSPATTPAQDTTPAGNVDEPVDGPFLSDQKVEKRPLGAFNTEAEPDEPAAAESEANRESPVQPAADQPANLPPEFQPEAVKAEASEVPEANLQDDTSPVDNDTSDMSPIEEQPADTAAGSVEQKLDDKSPKPVEQTETADKVADKPPVDTINLAGQSIAPQYKPEATDNDNQASAGSVFDTKEYHQPLTPTAGKTGLKKVTGVIGLIILLILIGAAIGYAYYVYRTGGF
ncbi:MAG TPA: hypothetical protein VFK03_03765 [Candidatus Saccharimonadales bacterium]|nr:hypothetical protein [Candidatus Saccharimonadales bacterium]